VVSAVVATPTAAEASASHAQVQAAKPSRLMISASAMLWVVSDKYNDGDSFKVRTPNGEELEIRLYFVDTNESKDKRFEDHKARVQDQANYFGLSYDQAIQLGATAKRHTAEQLAQKPLTILTKRELVYGGPRIYAFVYIDGIGWWPEHLVRNGLARIHTKGADMPDGTHWQKRKDILKRLETEAQANKRGGWSL